MQYLQHILRRLAFVLETEMKHSKLFLCITVHIGVYRPDQRGNTLHVQPLESLQQSE